MQEAWRNQQYQIKKNDEPRRKWTDSCDGEIGEEMAKSKQ